MKPTYEWDVEVLNITDPDDEEVVDHNHCDSFVEAIDTFEKLKDSVAEDYNLPSGTPLLFRIVLVRDAEIRSWAYLNDNGTLPENFLDAYGHERYHVPFKFLNEVKSNTATPSP